MNTKNRCISKNFMHMPTLMEKLYKLHVEAEEETLLKKIIKLVDTPEMQLGQLRTYLEADNRRRYSDDEWTDIVTILSKVA